MTKVWGSHAVEGWVLLPEQLQAAEHLRQLQQPDRLHRQRQQPVRHGLQLRERGDRRVQQLHAGLQVRAAGMALPQLRVVRAGQLEAEQPVHARLRPAVLLPDAAVGHDAAGVELPAGPVQSERGRDALHAGLHRRVALLGREPARDGPGARLRRVSRRRWPTRSISGSSAGSRPARIGSTARSRPVRGSTTSCRTATPSGSRLASARSTT